ncbi:hypothetical protein SAMN04488062_101132 [Flavobacterium omnivorum]|uniref:Beta-lactamase-inhibitor-like, PepSY-like n=1 Tax=Flavobacterium omnivorum TaxID=178355 RepID=A0A1G7VSK2_9FLAO|nr:hypothetical protein [Flavobacterium omnivorum]SDG62399.1 hypothetical protein SAMN04488062_101132 [Flavobacterium omnivorum]
MKKLILSAAIILGSVSTYAITVPSTVGVVQTTTIQEEYIEVKLGEVPVAIMEALKGAYPKTVLDKAYINAAKEYKLEVTMDGKKGNLFADENGKWIKK